MEIGAIGVYLCLFMGLYFEVFLLICFLEKRPVAKTSARPQYYPTVSILVPCWNKAKTLAATVHSLLELDYPHEKLSVVIIDDGSVDGTFEVAQEFARNPRVQIFRKENEGSKYSALNFGLAQSQSELVGCLDADSFVARDALIEVVKKFESNKAIMAVTPAMRVHHPKTALELMQSVEYTFGVFYRKMFDNLSAITVIPGPFSFYRREIFQKIGQFRFAHHTEDMEMAFRMHANGFLIGNAHNAIVSTKVPTTVGALIRQRVRWSRGFLENARDYRHMFFKRKFGNLGLFALPFGVTAFIAGLYTSFFALFQVVALIVRHTLDTWATGVPPHIGAPKLEWFFINTSMLTFVIVAITGLTVFAILIGSRIAQTRVSVGALASYFMLFGFLAPVWLTRATWDTITKKKNGWLV